MIGKGGSKISDLQFESGAKINVTKETEGDETFIKISGTEEEKIKAKELIIDLTVERKPRNPDRYQHVESSSRPSNSIADNSKPIDWSIVFQECVNTNVKLRVLDKNLYFTNYRNARRRKN